MTINHINVILASGMAPFVAHGKKRCASLQEQKPLRKKFLGPVVCDSKVIIIF